MEIKYGKLSREQIAATKEKMRKQIFFLLVAADPETRDEYEDISVPAAFDNILSLYGGLNDLLGYPVEFVAVIALINAAYLEYKSDKFNWKKYRKLVLDAGSAVLKIKEE